MLVFVARKVMSRTILWRSLSFFVFRAVEAADVSAVLVSKGAVERNCETVDVLAC
jgi:hypothetical protein